MEQALQGNIGRFTLPEIFQLIANARKTGTLGIQKDDDIVMIYFDKGKIIYGYGPRQTYHLGQLLKESGRITENQLADAVKTQSRKESSKRLGEILVAKKFIGKGDLEKVIKEQVEELVYSLLSWESGTFKFYENQYPTQEDITVDVSVENAILEGMRRYDELNKIKEVLPDFNKVLAITATPPERKVDITLRSEEWNILSHVTGRRTINEIIRHSGLARMEALRKLAALKLAGLVSIVKDTEERPDRLSEMVDRVSGLLEEYIERKKGVYGSEKTTVQKLSETAQSRISGETFEAAVSKSDEEEK